MKENESLQTARTDAIRTLVARIDAFSDALGRGVAWLVPGMAVLTFLIVVLRYVFNLGWVWMQEAVLYLHAAFFMLAMGYTLRHEGHVRVDIFFQKMSAKRKAQVDFWVRCCCCIRCARSYSFSASATSWIPGRASKPAPKRVDCPWSSC